MKIVKLKNGMYAVRKRRLWCLWYVYLDLAATKYWWGKGSQYYKDCLGSLDDVEEALRDTTDEGTPI